MSFLKRAQEAAAQAHAAATKAASNPKLQQFKDTANALAATNPALQQLQAKAQSAADKAVAAGMTVAMQAQNKANAAITNAADIVAASVDDLSAKADSKLADYGVPQPTVGSGKRGGRKDKKGRPILSCGCSGGCAACGGSGWKHGGAGCGDSGWKRGGCDACGCGCSDPNCGPNCPSCGCYKSSAKKKSGKKSSKKKSKSRSRSRSRSRGKKGKSRK